MFFNRTFNRTTVECKWGIHIGRYREGLKLLIELQ